MKCILKSWMSKRHALQPIPMGNLQGQLSAMASAREDAESDGLYSAAQRNAQQELKKRHRYEPVRKSSRTPVLTPRMLRNSTESKKSPTIDAQQQQRTMRKAPHRLGHYRAASGGSQTQIVSPAVQPDSPRARANTSSSSRANFYLQPPRFPQQLTKEFVREKLLEWQLEKAFQKYFGSEEVDEMTFATLREEEVRQVMARRDDKNNIDGLCFRFVGLIQEIKRCTASSELL